MKAYERFLKYVSVWTTSDENSETVPSADRELVLAKLLVEEMKELGIVDARVDIVPDVATIRGGTDGARLSFKDFLVRILEQADMHSTGYMSTLQ